MNLKIKELENKIKVLAVGLDSYNLRHFDIALNSDCSDQLTHVIENTTNRTIQDYALLKQAFFREKEQTK